MIKKKIIYLLLILCLHSSISLSMDQLERQLKDLHSALTRLSNTLIAPPTTRVGPELTAFSVADPHTKVSITFTPEMQQQMINIVQQANDPLAAMDHIQQQFGTTIPDIMSIFIDYLKNFSNVKEAFASKFPQTNITFEDAATMIKKYERVQEIPAEEEFRNDIIKGFFRTYIEKYGARDGELIQNYLNKKGISVPVVLAPGEQPPKSMPAPGRTPLKQFTLTDPYTNSSVTFTPEMQQQMIDIVQQADDPLKVMDNIAQLPQGLAIVGIWEMAGTQDYGPQLEPILDAFNQKFKSTHGNLHPEFVASQVRVIEQGLKQGKAPFEIVQGPPQLQIYQLMQGGSGAYFNNKEYEAVEQYLTKKGLWTL